MMNALRMIIAAMVLLPLLIARRKDLNLTRRDLPQLAILAIIGIVLAKTFEFWGLASPQLRMWRSFSHQRVSIYRCTLLVAPARAF